MKKIFNYVILAVVTLIVLVFSLKDHFWEIIHELVTMKLGWLLIAFLMIVIFWFCKSLAFHIFNKHAKRDFKYHNSLLLVMRTQFMNAITPFATGGQPYQVFFLRKCGISASVATGVIVQNFIVYQIVLVFLGLVAMFSNYVFHIFPKSSLLSHLIILGFIINTFVIILSFVVSFGKKINKKIINFGIKVLTKFKLVKDREQKLKDWDIRINNFHNSASTLFKNKKIFICTLGLNFISLVCLYSVPFFVLRAMDNVSVSIGLSVITSAYVMLIGSFVPIPGGTGGLEYGYGAFYGFFVKGSVLSASMLIWRFITYYLGLIVGGIAMNIKRVK